MVTVGVEQGDGGAAVPTVSTSRKAKIRSRLVCSRCHEKKIKCDIQTRTAQGSGQCRNCSLSQAECKIRKSRRGVRRRNTNAGTAASPGNGAGRDEERHDSMNQGTSGAAVSQQQNSAEIPSEVAYSLLQLNPGAHQQPHDADMTGDGTLDSITVPPLPSVDSGYSPGNASADSGSRPAYAPAQGSCTSGRSQPRQHQTSYLGDSGYMNIFGFGDAGEGESSRRENGCLSGACEIDIIPPALQASYADTFFENAHVWCPVIERRMLQENPDVTAAPGLALLRHALAVCGNHIKPPLVQHASSLAHYKRAKSLFYNADDISPLVRISAIMLFYWWSVGPPSVVSMDSSWWWTGAAIRIAQEIGLHREPLPHQELAFGETVGLRRRIWWTLFARDRITGISQGRPCIIDLDYCDVKMISVDDFPDPTDINAELFVEWVGLSVIIGHIGKHLCARKDTFISTAPLAGELVNWVQSLPPRLKLQIGGGRTASFNREVHGLNLVYLVTIILLNLQRSTAGQILPEAGKSAIIAASCVARIFEDYMARGSVRFLAGQAGWYIAVSILALIHARRSPHLRVHADQDTQMLRTALREMATLWHSAKVYNPGIEKLMALTPPAMPDGSAPAGDATFVETDLGDSMNCLDYFPYITSSTSPLIHAVLAEDQVTKQFEELQWPIDPTDRLYDFLMSPANFAFDDFNLQGV